MFMKQKSHWHFNPRVRIAPSSAAIASLDALIDEQPVLCQAKDQTKKEWREKQMQILAHHPLRPGHLTGRERSE